jgi:hypothetical protein
MFFFPCARLRDINDTVSLKNRQNNGWVLIHAAFICADHGQFSNAVMIKGNEVPFYFS